MTDIDANQGNGGKLLIKLQEERQRRYTCLISLILMNEHFHHINTDCHYESPKTMTITDDTYVPIIDENTTVNFLSTVKRTAAGPDGIGHLEGFCS